MHVKKIDIDSIEEGLDRKQLVELKKRFLKINQQRLSRTRETLPYRQQIFIELLPLLLHTNHPVLPGYVNHQCPAGIHNYSPSKAEIKQAVSLARSFRFNQRPDKQAQIEAIFLMGSGGTIAQSKSSDLDIWVCHVDQLSQEERSQLKEKCHKLSQWAAQLGLETHFFPMVASDFRAGKLPQFTKESSGSAQHILLLDEFYRTALLVAGKMPLWWLVPVDCEHTYGHYTDILLSRRYVRASDYLDFGPVAALPMGEFVGAAVWQLYKAIESPYKSVLKLMLLEVYAHHYPATETLSLLFKRRIYCGELDIDRLDPYFLIYQLLQDYLLTKGDRQRLELVRRCFYFKVAKPLTKPLTGTKKSWQRQLLENLVSEWQWHPNYLRLLDTHQHWKADWVAHERKALVHELTSCYRFVVEFSRRDQADVRIDPQEFAVLGRKLHASFERRAGKMDWINPGISSDLGEASLVFVEHYDEYLHDTKWVVYAVRDDNNATLHQSPAQSAQVFERHANDFGPELKQGRYLPELLVWCYCNQILTANTRCEIKAVNFNASERLLEHLHLALKHWVSLPLAPVTHDRFKQSAHLCTALFLINVGVDPFPDMRERGMQRISEYSDALNYGKEHHDLVLSIDLVTLNSWNEVETHHFEGEALVRCLLHFMSKIFRQRQASVPAINVYCGTPIYGNSIRQRVEQFLNDALKCFVTETTGNGTFQFRQPRYVFQIAKRFYCLQLNRAQPKLAQPKLVEAEDEDQLQRLLSQKQEVFSPLMIDPQALSGSALQLIAGVSDSNAVQVFYALESYALGSHALDNHQTSGSRLANIYVLDEKGSLFTTQAPFIDEQTLLRPLHHFIRAVIDRQNIQDADNDGGFGVYPVEFYRLHRAGANPASRRNPRRDNRLRYTHMERCRFGTDLNQLPFFNVQVIAQPAAPNHLSFSIFCDDVEFSELQHGPRLFHEVTRYILSKRRENRHYPCYITDMDLSQCLSLIAPNGGLQVSHYLEIKAPLERKINAALNRETG